MTVLEVLPGLYEIHPTVYSDNRGFFFESYNEWKFNDAIGHIVQFVQDNHSRSHKGILRGLHYQGSDYPQGKLVRVSSGSIFDVAVDIRKGSPTYGQWYSVELSDTNYKMLYLSPGFAHGFLSLRDCTDVVYKTTEYYHPECEKCIIWNDPDLGIKWPSIGFKYILSPKDELGIRFKES